MINILKESISLIISLGIILMILFGKISIVITSIYILFEFCFGFLFKLFGFCFYFIFQSIKNKYLPGFHSNSNARNSKTLIDVGKELTSWTIPFKKLLRIKKKKEVEEDYGFAAFASLFLVAFVIAFYYGTIATLLFFMKNSSQNEVLMTYFTHLPNLDFNKLGI